MDPFEFLEKIAYLLENRTTEFPRIWENNTRDLPQPEFSYSEMAAIGTLIKSLPTPAALHLGNSSAVRYAQLYTLPEDVEVCCNRGTSGIEGSLSTAIGYSVCSDKLNFVRYLMEKTVELRTNFGMFVSMEMSRKTFIKSIIGSKDFGEFYKQSFDSKEVQLSAGLMSSEMATTIFRGLGLPPIVINEDLVELSDGTFKQVFKDNRISLFTTPKQGKMRWHTPYEITDPVPGKTYTRSEGGMYISNIRTDEGRFMEYGAEWIPEFTSPNKIVIFDLDTMNA